jgi:hypothetical protein
MQHVLNYTFGLILLGFSTTISSNDSLGNSEGARPRCSNNRIFAEIREYYINESINVAVRLIEKDYQKQNEDNIGGLGKNLESVRGKADKIPKEQQEEIRSSVEDFTRKNSTIEIRDVITENSKFRQAKCTATIITTIAGDGKSQLLSQDISYNVMLTDEGNTIWRMTGASR